MAFDPDQFLASTAPTQGGGFDPDAFLKETEPKSVAGFGKNLLNDVSGTAKSLVGPGGLGERLLEHPVDTAVDVVKGIPGAVVNEGKRLGAGELLTGHPINAVEKFGQAAYDKPLTTALDVAPVVGAAGKMLGIGGEAADAAKLAGTAGEAAAKTAPEAAADILGAPKGTPTPPPAAGAAAAPGIVDDLKNYIGPKVDAAKGAINGAYAKQAGRPGWSTDVADYLQGKSQMMAAQDLGATPFQARQAGHEAMRAIGQYAIDNDIVSPTNGLRGMRARNAQLLNKAGDIIGQMRQEADKLRDPVTMPVDVLQEVRNRLDGKYARGAYSGQHGQYAKALEDVEDSAPTFEGAAKTATKLNKAANEAAKIKQPHGPYTDVANAISEINNERIKTLLGTEKAAQYEQALRDFGVNKKIQSFLDRKAGGEVKRIGPGSFTSNMVQKGMDELGYKVGARALNKTSTAVLKNPGVAKTLPSLFKQFIHDVDLPEPEALAHGGIVGQNELNDFLSSKYTKGVPNK